MSPDLDTKYLQKDGGLQGSESFCKHCCGHLSWDPKLPQWVEIHGLFSANEFLEIALHITLQQGADT